MASPFAITQYRDPEKLDIAVLGKAATYKQQNYDVNTAQTQQLINQYAGTDLLRDVDKQYFGERLNTLVNYIDQSGTRDWSRKNVASDIQNYVSSALDKNVLNAISSTQAYRKQMAEIEDIKKNKPDQYSLQNQWFATRGLDEYLRSNKVGDTYNAGTYVPYTDVKKILLENAPKLKEFGVEYHFDPIGGNQYFTQIGKSERISPETAKQYLGMIMDTKVQNQLYIDGQYAYKDLAPEQVKQQFDTKLNSYLDYNNNRIDELNALKVSATKEQKAQIDSNIAVLQQDIKNINTTKGITTSKDSMINSLYNADFMDKWTGFLSYDRIVDWKMDQSGFELEKYGQDLKQRAWENTQKYNEFQYRQQNDAANRELDYIKMQNDAITKGFKLDADGKAVYDPTSQINLTDTAKDLEEVEKPPVVSATQAEYNRNIPLMLDSVKSDLDKALQDPKNAELKKLIGNSSKENIAWQILNTPSKNAGLLKYLSPDTRTIIDKTREGKNKLNAIDSQNESVLKEISELGQAMANSGKPSTVSALQDALDGHTIDSKGNVIKGSIELGGNNKNAVLARTLGAINFRLMSGNLSADEEAQFRRMATTSINKSDLSPTQKKNALNLLIYQKSYDGFWSGLGKLPLTSGLGTVVKNVAKGVNVAARAVTNNPNSKVGMGVVEYIDNVQGNRPNVEGIAERIGRGISDRFRPNRDTNSIGTNSVFGTDDVDVSKLSFDPSNMEDRWRLNMANTTKSMEDYTTTFNRTMNISGTTNFGKSILPSVQSYFPVGTEFQKDGNFQITVDQESGMATIVAPVKVKGGYESATTQVSISQLPTSVTNNIKMEEKNKLYSTSNPFAVNYSTQTEIPRNLDEWSEKVELLPANERTSAFKNPPTTQADIMTMLNMSYSPELIAKHQQEISKVLNSGVEIYNENDSGKWTIIAKQNGKRIYTQETSDTTYDPVLMDRAVNKISTQAILEKIKDIMK